MTLTVEQPVSPSTHRTLRLLFTCVDNRGRTVLAKRLLERELMRASPRGVDRVDVLVAGGHKTHPGAGVHRHAAAELRRLGLDDAPEPPARLRPEDLQRADLVVVFERDHRTELFQYHPRLLRTCFTLGELSEITDCAPEVTSGPVADRITRAAGLRHLGARARDVPETWRQGADAHRAAADAIHDCIPALVRLLT